MKKKLLFLLLVQQGITHVVLVIPVISFHKAFINLPRIFFFTPLLPQRGLVQHFLLLAERLEQDSDVNLLHHSDLSLDGHYYMLFAENSKICLNSESQQRSELRMERDSQILGKEIIQKRYKPNLLLKTLKCRFKQASTD